VDLATLTGACVVALGDGVSAVMGTDQKLVERLLDAGSRAGEYLWQLPLVEEYREGLKSTVADIKNVGNSCEAGTMAGAFYLKKLLRRYVRTDDPVPYALADYNAGRGNVLKWITGAAATNSAAFIGQIAFPGTKDYVKSIMKRFRYYQPIFRTDQKGWAHPPAAGSASQPYRDRL